MLIRSAGLAGSFRNVQEDTGSRVIDPIPLSGREVKLYLKSVNPSDQSEAQFVDVKAVVGELRVAVWGRVFVHSVTRFPKAQEHTPNAPE
ncbi:MAG: hypothetical protein O2923_10825 [Verrucomicrobia bacterium]|nr:hypothetical protein [Verrucomicrobiota bacterium]MDA1087122.1 hypothetical protein [Verrucomicrobiota bacterium]